jgi:hypothetical protein
MGQNKCGFELLRSGALIVGEAVDDFGVAAMYPMDRVHTMTFSAAVVASGDIA